MAGVNEILDGRINLALSRRLGMSSGPATTLAPEIMAQLDLGDMPELLFNLGWKRYQNSMSQVANGALATKWQIRLPDHATLVIVEKIVVSSDQSAAAMHIAGSWGYGPAVADLATISNSAFFRDGRTKPSGLTAVFFSMENSAAFGAPFSFNMALQPKTPTEIPGAPWVLWRGNALLIESQENNVDLRVSCVWRERPPVTGEQQPLPSDFG